MTRIIVLVLAFGTLVMAQLTETVSASPIPALVVHFEKTKPKAGRTRPLVAIIADNAGTETTDLIVPYGVLKEADVADVVIVSTGRGAVQLMPALRILADMTMAEFDAQYREGADIVIVPALHDSGNATISDWIAKQHRSRAFVFSICEGAWLAAKAGVLLGKEATTHWYAMDNIASKHAFVNWVRDRRYVVDGDVMTTTGVTASLPASLALIEALAGNRKAAETAKKFGVETWGAEHDSNAFHLTTGTVGLVAWNYMSFWQHERLTLSVSKRMDEVALAFVADAWARTYSSQVLTKAHSTSIRTRHGLVLLVDKVSEGKADLHISNESAVKQLDQAIDGIGRHFGKRTADVVALQLEYPDE